MELFLIDNQHTDRHSPHLTFIWHYRLMIQRPTIEPINFFYSILPNTEVVMASEREGATAKSNTTRVIVMKLFLVEDQHKEAITDKLILFPYVY